MLKKLLLVAIVIGFYACKKEQKDGFRISGTTDSYISGSTARLFAVTKQKKKVIDSTILENGAFVFEGKISSPDMYYITIDNVLGAFSLILSHEEFELEVITDSIAGSKIIGSKSNDDIDKYMAGSQYLRDTKNVLSGKFNTFRLADNKEGMQSVKNSYDSLVLESVKYDVSYLKKYPNDVLSALILERISMAKQISDDEANTLYNSLSKDLQASRPAKYALEFIAEQNKKTKNKQ